MTYKETAVLSQGEESPLKEGQRPSVLALLTFADTEF